MIKVNCAALPPTLIIEALNTTEWRASGKDGAAEVLGLNSKTLTSRMQRLGIQRNKKNA